MFRINYVRWYILKFFFKSNLTQIWQQLLGADELRKSARKNTYKELLMRARLVSKDIKQIDLDINRTYRDNLAFRRRYDVK